MYKSETGVKSKLILELLVITYLFIAVLATKYIFKGPSTASLPGLSWLIVFGCYSVYNKKYNDLVDESSKFILSKVNQIAITIMMYSIVIIAIFFATPYTRNINISNQNTGIILIAVLFIQSLSKLILYMYFDKRGICN
ncbi:hypothetical protein HGQ85_11865 [Clostridioides difficile]|nr:hypothetical protein [Clostridioides difficile]